MPLLKTIQDLELVGLICPYFLYGYQVCVCSAMTPDAKIIYLSKCTTLVQTEIWASRHPGSRTVSLSSYIWNVWVIVHELGLLRYTLLEKPPLAPSLSFAQLSPQFFHLSIETHFVSRPETRSDCCKQSENDFHIRQGT